MKNNLVNEIKFEIDKYKNNLSNNEDINSFNFEKERKELINSKVNDLKIYKEAFNNLNKKK